MKSSSFQVLPTTATHIYSNISKQRSVQSNEDAPLAGPLVPPIAGQLFDRNKPRKITLLVTRHPSCRTATAVAFSRCRSAEALSSRYLRLLNSTYRPNMTNIRTCSGKISTSLMR